MLSGQLVRMMIVFDDKVHNTNNLVYGYLNPDKPNSGKALAFLVASFTTLLYRVT